jgi:hypothetical protein
MRIEQAEYRGSLTLRSQDLLPSALGQILKLSSFRHLHTAILQRIVRQLIIAVPSVLRADSELKGLEQNFSNGIDGGSQVLLICYCVSVPDADKAQ